MELEGPKIINYLDSEYYEHYKIFLVSCEECELCKKGIHDTKEHKYMYSRAYNKLKNSKRDSHFKRGCYNNKPNPRLTECLNKYISVGLFEDTKHEPKRGYSRIVIN